MTTTLDKIQNAHKACWRAGDFLRIILQKDEKNLTAEECLKIQNSYGFGPKEVAMIALSTGFSIDEEGYARLVDEQVERSKNTVPCCKESCEKESCCKSE